MAAARVLKLMAMLLCFILTEISKDQYQVQYKRDNSYLILSSFVSPQMYTTKDVFKPMKCINKMKWSFNRVAYCSNTTASRQFLLICGDVESNP